MANISANKISLPEGQSYTEGEIQIQIQLRAAVRATQRLWKVKNSIRKGSLRTERE